jgi:23S rRNA (cytosine1962-C5)-methyltransferase
LIEADVAALPVVTLKTPTPHPNIFRKRIQDIPGDVRPGSCVSVRLPDDSHVGFGYCNPQSSIALRMISTQPDPPDVAHWDRLLERAVRLRIDTLKLDEVTNACRLINGDGDFLPGLVADRYDDVLSVEAFSLAMFRRHRGAARQYRWYAAHDHSNRSVVGDPRRL